MAHTDYLYGKTTILRHLHSPDHRKTFGYVTFDVMADEKPREFVNSSDAVRNALFRAGLVNGKIIDKCNGNSIVRLTYDGMSFGFILVPFELPMIDANSADRERYSTLTEARKAAGFVVNTPTAGLTPPKSANPQNRPGYRADTAKAK